jgi:penicillin-binding protein 1A
MDQHLDPPRRRARRPWRLLLVTLLALAAAGTAAVVVLVLTLLPTLPPVQQLADAELKVPLRVYTADGELIAEFGDEKRIPVQIDAVPPRLIQAIIAAEDHNFYRHFGVDVLGILRAAWHNLRTGSAAQGASTITMQVARNFFLSPEKTYTRKLKELLLALKIERELTKGQILELYINKIFLGHRAYGFAAAAQIYYGTPLAELTLPQLAMLAGLPKAPSRDNPLTNPDNALERRNYVLGHMHQLGYIDRAELEQALAAPLTASRHSIRYALEAPYVAEMVRQHMVQTYDEKAYAGGFHVYTTIRADHQRAANRALRDALLEYDRRHGYRGPVARVQLEEPVELARLDDVLKDYRVVGDLVPGVVTQVAEQTATVYTLDGTSVELDWDALAWARPYIDENRVGDEPRTAADVLRRGDIVYLEALGQTDEGTRWRLAQIPEVAGALVSLRPRDGAILALVGGFDFYQSSFNRAIQAERQPGSGLKPFVYAAALEKGFTPATTVSGAPIVIEDANLEDEWRPQNYSERFFGPTRLRKALALSLNLVSVRLLRAIGPAYAADYLTRFGFERDKLPRNLSLALGNASATPLQMATAFAVFANGGFRVQPYFIERIEDAAHTVLEQAEPFIACPECEAAPPGEDARAASARSDSPPAESAPAVRPAPRVLSPELAFIMTSMLQDVVREGTARRALVLGRDDLAGKTGTTDEYRDAWFNGFNDEVVATAWVGFDQLAPLGRGEAGARAALPMWIAYMREALAGVPERERVPPPGVIRAYIDAETGAPLPGPAPGALVEYFREGTEGVIPIPPEVASESPQEATTAVAEPVAPPEPVRPPPTQRVRERLF